MITVDVHQRALPDTRTATLACKWQATCVHAGKTHVVESRAGATHELARTLINAGTPDGVMVVYTEGRAGHMTIPSIAEWAKWTYSGDQRVLYETAQASIARMRARFAGAVLALFLGCTAAQATPCWAQQDPEACERAEESIRQQEMLRQEIEALRNELTYQQDQQRMFDEEQRRQDRYWLDHPSLIR